MCKTNIVHKFTRIKSIHNKACKNIAFSISKSHFIYFNNSIYNTPDLNLLEVGLLGSTCLRWVFLSLRFFCLDWLCCIFGLIWYFGALGLDDFVGLEKIVILRFLIFGF